MEGRAAVKTHSVPLNQVHWLGRALLAWAVRASSQYSPLTHTHTNRGPVRKQDGAIVAGCADPLCPGRHLVRVGMASASLFPSVSSDPGQALVHMHCMNLEDETISSVELTWLCFQRLMGLGTELLPGTSRPDWAQDHFCS